MFLTGKLVFLTGKLVFLTGKLVFLTGKLVFLTGDCLVPSINNAVLGTTMDVVEHSTEVSVLCGTENLVIKCYHGTWSHSIIYCPSMYFKL